MRQRLEILGEIDQLQVSCESCGRNPLRAYHLRLNYSACMTYCRKECTTGQQIQALGDQLLGAVRTRKKITGNGDEEHMMDVNGKPVKVKREEYLAYRMQGLSRKEIAKKLGYTLNHFETYWLKKWGLRDPAQEELALIDYGKAERPAEPQAATGLQELNAKREEGLMRSSSPVAQAVEARAEAAKVISPPSMPVPSLEVLKQRIREMEEIHEQQKRHMRDEKARYHSELEEARQKIVELENRNIETVALAGQAAEAHAQAQNRLNERIEQLEEELQQMGEEREMLLATIEKAVAPAEKSDPNSTYQALVKHGAIQRQPTLAERIGCIDAIEATVRELTGGQAYAIGAAVERIWAWSRSRQPGALYAARAHLDRLIGE